MVGGILEAEVVHTGQLLADGMIWLPASWGPRRNHDPQRINRWKIMGYAKTTQLI